MSHTSLFTAGLLAIALATSSSAAIAQDEPLAQDDPFRCVSTDPGASLLQLPNPAGAFGAYEMVPLLGDEVPYAGPATPGSMDEVTLTKQVKRDLSPEAISRLAEQGFVIMPEGFRLFHHAYDGQYWEGTPVYVTTDVAYHAWHQVFDKTLRDIETRWLLPELETLVGSMRENAALQVDELAGTPLADDAAAVYDLISVAAAKLGLKRKGKLSKRAKAERALVDAHSSVEESPILGTVTDYSLFTPRGHYTRTEELTRYFVAMSILGQHAFRLPGSIQTDASTVDDTRGVLLAMLASRTLVDLPELEAMWRTIFEPTAFLVGVSDDYSPWELAEAIEAVAPGGWADPASIADEATLTAIAEELLAKRPVQIDPERPSIRLMGTRFVLDSWILDQMVGPCVGLPQPGLRRPLASPLDLAAVFGSDFALGIQEAADETEFANYPEQMAALRDEVAARSPEAWGTTVYDAWLKAVEPMWLPHGAAFPDYMQTDAWKAKAQQTGLGSYAELKHDTILYTKQAVGEMGSAGEPPFAYNWVEPDPVAFGRLRAMAELMRDGLVERQLMGKKQRRLVNDYIRFVSRLERIAADELAGVPLSEDDNDWLKVIGGELEGFWWRTGEKLRSNSPIIDDDAAIIADIVRGVDPDTGTDEVLEIGTGRIDRIYVLVPDADGHFHVSSGGVYSYYEFPWPTQDRLTDEQWWKMLKRDEAPDRPEWTEPLFP